MKRNMCCPEIDEQTINKSDKHDNYNTTLKNNKTYKHIIKYVFQVLFLNAYVV